MRSLNRIITSDLTSQRLVVLLVSSLTSEYSAPTALTLSVRLVKLLVQIPRSTVSGAALILGTLVLLRGVATQPGVSWVRRACARTCTVRIAALPARALIRAAESLVALRGRIIAIGEPASGARIRVVPVKTALRVAVAA